MDKKIIKFDDTEIEEYEFHQYKSLISINDIDINKIIVSNKFPFSKQDFEYFISYNDAKKIRPLCIFLPKNSVYLIDFDKSKCTSFLIKDEIGEKVSYSIKKEFNSESVYNKKLKKKNQHKRKLSMYLYTSNID